MNRNADGDVLGDAERIADRDIGSTCGRHGFRRDLNRNGLRACRYGGGNFDTILVGNSQIELFAGLRILIDDVRNGECIRMSFEDIEGCWGYGQVLACAVIGAGDALSVLAGMFACSIQRIYPSVVLAFLRNAVFAASFFVFFANQRDAGVVWSIINNN